MDEQEKKETNQAKEKYNQAKQSAKRGKNIIKVIGAIKSIIAGIISFVNAFWPIILGAVLIFALWYLVDKIGDNFLDSVASKATMREEVDIQYDEEEDEYNFKIDKDVDKKYLEFLNQAYYEGYYHYKNPDLDKEAFVYDENDADFTDKDLEEWFRTKDYKKYIVKMIRAQIASSYPRLAEDQNDNVRIDPSIDPINPIDKNGNYVQQGIAEIQRTSLNKDGTTGEARLLKYLPYDNSSGQVQGPTFKSLVESNDPEALNYFSFSIKQESEDAGLSDSTPGVIYYATYEETVVTVNGTEVPELHRYEIKENTKSYETITNLCEMPFNFLFVLLKETENPEYVMAVIDLLLNDSKIVLMIQDELAITTDTQVDTSYHAQKTVTSNYYSVEDPPEGSGKYYWQYSSESVPNYSYPSGSAEITTTVTTTYENTANVFLKEAHTWCIDFEQGVAEPVNYKKIDGEEHVIMSEYSNSDFASLSYNQTGGGNSLGTPTSAGQTGTETIIYTSTSTLLYSTSEKLDRETYTWDIVPITAKSINYEKFLGLWKNNTGEYDKDNPEKNKYDPNGKLVKFDLPADSGKNFNVPVTEITVYSGQRIDGLINLLEDCEDTEMQEQLMKLYWNKFTDDEESTYDVDENDVLDYFNMNLNDLSINRSYGTILVNGCNLTREEFISFVENYKTSSTYQEKFASYAGSIYDICVSKNINPILCVAVAGQESNFGEHVPANSQYNYWGIGVYNGTSTGTTFNSIEDAIGYWCDLIIRYQSSGTSQNELIKERSSAFKAVNNKFTGTATNVYDLWSIYAWLGDDHQSTVYGSVSVKEFIDTFLTNIECNHNLSDPTTVEEQAAYIEYYVDNGITKIAKEIFGNKAIGGNASAVADYALQFVGQNHSTFTSYYHINSNWCAMFVSYCFDKCGLIPDVLPSSYTGCSTEVRNLRKAGLFRERSSGYTPKAGDIVFFKSSDSEYISTHTGIVTGCDGIKVYTVEGNTSGQSSNERPAGVAYWQTSKVATHSYNLTSTYIVRLYGNIDFYGGKRFEKIKNHDNCNYNNNDCFDSNNSIINKK